MTRIKSILLVDDDPDDVELFKTALTKVADSVYLMTANSGDAALSLLSSSIILPDIIFMDINMPGMNGFDTISELKKIDTFRNIPTHIYSTSTSATDMQKAKQVGADRYLNKPMQFSGLCLLLLDFI